MKQLNEGLKCDEVAVSAEESFKILNISVPTTEQVMNEETSARDPDETSAPKEITVPIRGDDMGDLQACCLRGFPKPNGQMVMENLRNFCKKNATPK